MRSIYLAWTALALVVGCGTSREDDAQTIHGQVDVTAYDLDNPIVVAEADDAHVYAATIAEDGRFELRVPVGTTYRLVIANSTRQGAYKLVSQVEMPSSEGGAIWVRCKKGGDVDVGKVKPKKPDCEKEACEPKKPDCEKEACEPKAPKTPDCDAGCDEPRQPPPPPPPPKCDDCDDDDDDDDDDKCRSGGKCDDWDNDDDKGKKRDCDRDKHDKVVVCEEDKDPPKTSDCDKKKDDKNERQDKKDSGMKKKCEDKKKSPPPPPKKKDDGSCKVNSDCSSNKCCESKCR